MSWLIRAHGKLLLTGEYAVLDGAEALALPVRYGQTLQAQPTEQTGRLRWTSLDRHGRPWFEGTFSVPELLPLQASDASVARRLSEVLRACRHHGQSFLSDEQGWAVHMAADYPLKWGLGSSSTLVAALARWAQADPYAVLFDTFGGSGYDIACAFACGPIFYRLSEGKPQVQDAPFQPPFAEQLFFIFLEKKQDSREAIQRFRERAAPPADWLDAVSALTRRCVAALTLAEFGELLREHERLIGEMLGQPPIQQKWFPDFDGVVKSLGAWGGDFALCAAEGMADEIARYFLTKGFPVCIPYSQMLLPPVSPH